jgi:hypothetical protein
MHGFVERVAASYEAGSMLFDSALLGNGPQTVAPDGELPEQPVDVVVSLAAPERVTGWQEYLPRLARLARKALIVVARNAERPGQGSSPEGTELAGVLWAAGRVREHAYLAAPRMLAPADVVHAPAGRLVRRSAPFHAFVVDTRPRSRQARRRLRVADGTHGGA